MGFDARVVVLFDPTTTDSEDHSLHQSSSRIQTGTLSVPTHVPVPYYGKLEILPGTVCRKDVTSVNNNSVMCDVIVLEVP